MSSILDALNKLENEKEQARAQAELNPADIDPAAAADELLGIDSNAREPMTLRLSPMILLGSALLFIALTIGTVVATVSFLVKPAPDPQAIASTPAEPSPESEPVPAPTEPKPSPEPDAAIAAVDDGAEESTDATPAVVDPEPQPAPEPVAQEPVSANPAPSVQERQPDTVAAPQPTEAPEQKETALAQIPPDLLTTATNEPVNSSPSTLNPPSSQQPRKVLSNTIAPEPVAAEPVSNPQVAIPENIQTFPPFTVELQHRHGLSDFKVNMLNPESETNPYGSAIINRTKVFESSYINGSRVRLYKVDRRGIAVEIASTGNKYYAKF